MVLPKMRGMELLWDMKRFFWIIALSVAAAAIAAPVAVNPESLENALASTSGDSALSMRAQLAYARGLYHFAKELAERIDEPKQSDILLLGQCCHVLAEPFAARGYFSQIDDPALQPVALLGLAELYCGDIADSDSCEHYMEIVDGMDYLKRFVELTLPQGEAVPRSEEERVAGPWTLQFGAFKMQSLAQQMAIKVRKEGLRVRIVPKESDEGTLFFVYGGDFATKGEAAARSDALAKEFVCRVVEMPK